MRRITPFFILIVLFLSSCSNVGASPEVEDDSLSPPPSVDATHLEVELTESADKTSTLSPEPTEVPTVTPEPTATDVIPHLAGGQRVTIKTIHMFDPNTGWGIGGVENNEDHILITEDGGGSWIDRTPPETSVPEVGDTKSASAFFLDEDTAWVRYLDSTKIWRTSDSGRTWVAGQDLDVDIHIPIEIVPQSLQFVDEKTGWVMIYLESGMSHDWIVLYETVDSGNTWELLLHPSETGDLSGCCKTGLSFFDADTGIVTFGIGPYTAPHFALTLDGGRTWGFSPLDISHVEASDAEFTNCEAHSPHILSPSLYRLGMHCTTYGEPLEVANYIYTSENRGETWSFTTYPGGTLEFLDHQVGWALGRKIFRTTDGGDAWSWMSDVNWDAQFSFIDENLGWAVARAGDEIALVMTEDGGNTWALLEAEVRD